MNSHILYRIVRHCFSILGILVVRPWFQLGLFQIEGRIINPCRGRVRSPSHALYACIGALIYSILYIEGISEAELGSGARIADTRALGRNPRECLELVCLHFERTFDMGVGVSL